MEKFKSLFKFNPVLSKHVGIEREVYLTRDNCIVPIAQKVLSELPNREKFGYELSACQLEDRIGPCKIQDIHRAILQNEFEICKAEEKLNFERCFYEVGPTNMPLDIYPDTTGRYQKIVEKMPKPVLSAACRVIGTHVHIGMPDCKTALHVYNSVIKSIDTLCKMGDGSSGERLRLYNIVAPDSRPPHYNTWENFYAEAKEKGFDSDPRKCWHLIRISAHGTIEFRTFGATSEIPRLLSWAKKCYELCEKAI